MLALKDKLLKPAEYPGCSGSRNIQDNISDLKAQVAANHKVGDLLSVKNEKGLSRETITSVALTSRSIKRRSRYVTLPCYHGNKISGSQQTVVLQMRHWKKPTVGVYDFPLLDCSQDENGSPFFSSIVRQWKWPCLSRTMVENQKFCYHGNMTSHTSFVS